MANQYEVVEMERNAWHEDRTPIVSTRWPCKSEADAIIQLRVREVEAEIQGRTDVHYEAREDGKSIDRTEWEAPDDDVVFGALAEMGYTEEEILSVLQ